METPELTYLLKGTWQSAKGEVTAAVAFALAHGYNHLDAAWCELREKY